MAIVVNRQENFVKLLLLSRMPGSHLADILEGRYPQSQRQAIEGQIFYANMTASGRNPDLAAMTGLTNEVMTTLSNINLKEESLRVLGVAHPEDLSDAEAKEIMNRPENQDRLNDFLSAVQEMAEGIEADFNAPDFAAFRAGLQPENGPTAEQTGFERALAAMSQGLKNERLWKEMRGDYQNGAEINPAEAAAVRASLGVQRTLIRKDGVLTGQSTAKSAMISGLAEQTKTILTTAPDRPQTHEDYRVYVQGLTTAQVMNPGWKETGVERAAASAMYEQNQERVRTLDFGYRRDEANTLMRSAEVDTLDRISSYNTMVTNYMLSRGMTIEQIMDDEAARLKAGAEFKQYLRENSFLDPAKGHDQAITDERAQEKIQKLGELYQDIHTAVSNLKVEDIDFSDPLERAAYLPESVIRTNVIIDLSQTEESLRKRAEFTAVFGGAEVLAALESGTEMRTQIMVSELAKVDNPSEAMAIRSKEFYRMKRFGESFKGKTLAEIGARFGELPLDYINLPAIMLSANQYDYAGYMNGVRDINVAAVEQLAAGRELNRRESVSDEIDNVLLGRDLSPRSRVALYRSRGQMAPSPDGRPKDVTVNGAFYFDRVMGQVSTLRGDALFDSVYIDGKPAREFVAGLGYTPEFLAQNPDVLKAEIMGAATGARSHVDLVAYLPEGPIQVRELHINLNDLDSEKGRFNPTRSDRAAKLWAEDARARQAGIREEFLKRDTYAFASDAGRQMAVLLMMSENPQIRFADAGNEQNREQFVHAYARIQEAYAALNGNPPDRTKMSQIMENCMRTMTGLDLRREALAALGVSDPENLTAAQIKEIMSRPENQNMINDVLSFTSELAGNLSKEFDSEPLAPIRQELMTNGPAAEWNDDYNRAVKAMTDGLEGEVRWRDARRMYESGLGNHLDPVEMAALRSSLGMQRALIRKEGTVHDQSMTKSAQIRGLQAKTVELIRDDYSRNAPINDGNRASYDDYGNIAQNLSLADVMSGKQDMLR